MDKIDRVRKWMSGSKAPPWSIQIHPTNRCNLSCLFCCRKFEKIAEDGISDQRLLKIIDEAYELRVEQIELSGRAGDPMSRKISYQMAEKIKEYDMRGAIITNGTLFTSKQIEGLVKMGWDTVVFSLDGPNSATHDFLRGKGVFKKIVKVIKKFNQKKAELRSDKPVLSFLGLLTTLNYDKMEYMVRLAQRMNVKSVKILPMTIPTEDQVELDLLKLKEVHIAEFILSIKRAEEIAKECKVKFSLEQPIWGLIKYIRSDYKRNSAKKYDSRSNVKIKKRVSQNGRKPPCILPFTEMTIFAEGTVSPCCILWKREPEHIGDSVLDESLDKIWYGILFDHFRSKMKSGELPKYCRGCFL